jgi:predicted lipid-binding transport protein (Tim44 family)
MTDTPQFQKAEYAGTRSGDRCKMCGTTLGAAYWRVGTEMACQACAEKAKSELPTDTHSAFSRGVLFGIGGAILGLAIYATFTIVTGIILGYVSLAVGYLVGKAIKMGSSGMSGRRYQIAAAILTYAAVSMAAIPIGISQVVKAERSRHASHAQQTISPSGGSNGNATELPLRPADSNDNTATVTSPGPDTNAPPATTAIPPVNSKPVRAVHKIRWGAAIIGLAYIGLASPFLELAQNPVAGLIGLLILAVGIRIAWQITGAPGTPFVSGPFRNTSAASASSSPSASPAPPPPSIS